MNEVTLQFLPQINNLSEVRTIKLLDLLFIGGLTEKIDFTIV